MRAGPRINSPARAAPPPTGITSGLKMFTKPARPIPATYPSPRAPRSPPRPPPGQAWSRPPRAPASRWRAVPTPSLASRWRPPAPGAGWRCPRRAPRGSRGCRTAARSRGVEGHVTELPARSLGALKSTPWVMTPPPTPVPEGYEDLVLDVFAGPVAELAPGCGVRVVLHRDRQAGPAALSPHPGGCSLSSCRLGAKTNLVLGGQDETRDGHAHPAHLEAVFHLRDGPGDGVYQPVRRDRLGRIPTSLSFAFRGNHRGGDLGPAHVHPMAFIPCTSLSHCLELRPLALLATPNGPPGRTLALRHRPRVPLPLDRALPVNPHEGPRPGHGPPRCALSPVPYAPGDLRRAHPRETSSRLVTTRSAPASSAAPHRRPALGPRAAMLPAFAACTPFAASSTTKLSAGGARAPRRRLGRSPGAACPARSHAR